MRRLMAPAHPYERRIELRHLDEHSWHMKRPVLITALWAYAAWTIGGLLDLTMIDHAIGAALGPIMGIGAGLAAWTFQRKSTVDNDRA
jgi:hypothetical protein